MSRTSISYFVRYEGRAEDRDAFVDFYRTEHVPVLAQFPGIERIVLHTPEPWQDPFPVKPDRFELLAQMIFESSEALDQALRSEARALAREHFAGFPPFHGVVYHQAARSEEVWVR